MQLIKQRHLGNRLLLKRHGEFSVTMVFGEVFDTFGYLDWLVHILESSKYCTVNSLVVLFFLFFSILWMNKKIYVLPKQYFNSFDKLTLNSDKKVFVNYFWK